MEADLEVGEQDELRARFWIDFEARPMVARERLAQVTLPVRGLARFEPLREPDDGVASMVASGPHSTSKRANSRPISSNTLRLPRATAALARSSAAAGSTTFQTNASDSLTGMFAPNRLACVVTSLAAIAAVGDDRNAVSRLRCRSSFRIVVRPASMPRSRRCTSWRPGRGAPPPRPKARDRPA